MTTQLFSRHWKESFSPLIVTPSRRQRNVVRRLPHCRLTRRKLTGRRPDQRKSPRLRRRLRCRHITEMLSFLTPIKSHGMMKLVYLPTMICPYMDLVGALLSLDGLANELDSVCLLHACFFFCFLGGFTVQHSFIVSDLFDSVVYSSVLEVTHPHL